VIKRERQVPAPAMMRILETPIPLCIAIAMARERNVCDVGVLIVS